MKKLVTMIAMVVVYCLLSGTAAEARRLPWCGIYMNQYFGLSKRSLWLARNWAYEGTAAAGPAVGAVVVWPHHVGVIAGPPDSAGRWLVHSGNDGNAVRTRYRSLRGAIAFRHVGVRLASQDFNLEVKQKAPARSNQDLVSLRDSRRAAKALRQARSLTVFASVSVGADGRALAHRANFTNETWAQQVQPVRQRTRVPVHRVASAVGWSEQSVHLVTPVSETQLIHRAPRTRLALAGDHPNSRAWRRSALRMQADATWQGSDARALYVGAGADWRVSRAPPGRLRGYRR